MCDNLVRLTNELHCRENRQIWPIIKLDSVVVYENIELISLTIHLLFLKLEDNMGSFSFYWQRIKFAELEN